MYSFRAKYRSSRGCCGLFCSWFSPDVYS